MDLSFDICGEDIVSELCCLGVEHDAVIIESHTSLLSCFQNGVFNPQEEGKHLLSFFLRSPWDGHSAEVQELIKAKILSLVQANGKEELIFRDCFLWINPGSQ